MLRKEDNFSKIILGLAIIAFFFLRFYLVEQRIIFNWDQARDAQVVSQILSGQLTLIGPQVLGPDKFFLGPYFYYLLAPFYLLTRGLPTAMVWFLACYNLIFVALFWLIVKKLFSAKTALFALLLWAVNPSLVANDIISWNPVVIPLITIIIWYWCFLGFKENDNRLVWPFLGLTLGLGINFHFQMIFLVPFVMLFFWLNKQLVNSKRIALAIIGFLVSFLPLILFDLRHNFLNSRLLAKFFANGQEVKNIIAWGPVLRNFIHGFLGFNLPLVLVLIIFLLLALALFLGNRRPKAKSFSQKFYLASFGLFLITLVGFSFYGDRPSEYYFNFLTPFIIIFLANHLAKKKLGQVVLLIIALFWLNLSLSRLKPLPFSLSDKMTAVNYLVAEFDQDRVNVAFSVPPSEDASYIYLINQAGYQIDAAAGTQYTIVVPPDKELASVVVGNIGLILPEKRE